MILMQAASQLSQQVAETSGENLTYLKILLGLVGFLVPAIVSLIYIVYNTGVKRSEKTTQDVDDLKILVTKLAGTVEMLVGDYREAKDDIKQNAKLIADIQIQCATTHDAPKRRRTA